ncbi:hypothetical protein F444_16302, partial [Phytophthora nicotianae P1976]
WAKPLRSGKTYFPSSIAWWFATIVNLIRTFGFALNSTLALSSSSMQFSNLQLPAWARSLVVEAWFGDDVVIAAQPELNLFTAALAALHWCIQTPARLWGWVLQKLRADPAQSCKLDLLPVALPAALPVPPQPMGFIDDFDDIKTQLQLIHAIVDDLACNPRCHCVVDSSRTGIAARASTGTERKMLAN